MKKKLQSRSLIRCLMRLTLIQFILSITLVSLSSAKESYSQKLSTQKIDFKVQNQNLKSTIRELEKLSKAKFIYSNSLLNIDSKISLELYNSLFTDVLDKVFRPLDINYTISGNQVVLQKRKGNLRLLNQRAVESVPFQREDLKVTGVVKDEKGESIVGASVIVKGTTRGQTTNADGRFEILVPGPESVLQFSLVGYRNYEIRVGNTTQFEIVLELDSKALEEVVVVGYGVQKASTVTGSIVDVKGDVLQRSPVINVSNTLAGRLPGLVVTSPSGEPGSDNSILRIRGANTLGDNSPLVVVDGIANRTLNYINPQDIESITVLKDASAAIYGSQAANGVILVTTKKGKTGKPQVSIMHNQGWTQPTVIPKTASSKEYAQMLNEINIYAGQQPRYTQDDFNLFENGSQIWSHPNTDWFEETFNNYAPLSKTALNINGGSEYLNYYVSLGVDRQDAIYKNTATKFNQINLRLNLDGKINNYIKYGVVTAVREYNRNYPTRSAADIFQMLLRGKPNLHAYWPSGENGPDIEYGNNPVVVTTNQTGYDRNKSTMLESRANIEIALPWVKNLVFTGNVGYDRTMQNDKLWQTPWTLYNWDGKSYDPAGKPILEAGSKGFATPQLTQDFSNTNLLTLNALLKYDLSIGSKHFFNALVGIEKIKGDDMAFSAFRRHYVSSALEELFAGGDAEKDNTGSSGLSARLNYFGRLNYDFANKYMFEFLWRYDGSFKFHEKSRFGFFPGVSAGWRVSNEEFWGTIKNVVNDFKIRASWGQTGNDRIDNYQFLSSYGFLTGANNVYVFNNSVESKILNELRIPNTNVTWEVANQSNVGIDLRFLNNKLSFTAEYFYNLRSNILWNRNASVPSSTGLTLPRENIGKVENQGIELQLGYSSKVDKFQYSISGNIATNRNRILFWDETPGIPDYQKSTGKQMNAELFYKATGIFKDQAAIDAYPHWAGARPGDIIFEDVNKDGKIDGLDRVRENKTTLPTLTGGVNVDLSYENFYMSVFFQGAAGAIRNRYYEMQGEAGNYLKSDVEGRWNTDNPNATQPRTWNRYNEYWRANSNTYWLEDSDYIRLKNLEIGYSLPKSFVESMRISKAQVFVSGQNLLTLTNVKDFDPETTSATAYPLNRVYNLGISIGF